MEQRNVCKDLLFGVAVGDALGVPVEFESREYLKRMPVKDFIGYGTYDQPAGTFSDDSSLTFCLAETLIEGFDLLNLANKFIDWVQLGYWTARGDAFDIGNTTGKAIERLEDGVEPTEAGGNKLNDNGNGSLMRILPLVVYIKDKPIEERFAITKQVSSLTHRHHYSIISCFYYLEFARLLLIEADTKAIYKTLQTTFKENLIALGFPEKDWEIFSRLLDGDIYDLDESDIQSSGFVVHTLEASIWCLLTTNTYKEAVLKAVNLGIDTDTTAAVVGGLAGLLHGFETIPTNWVKQLARARDIEDLAERLERKFC